MEWARPACTFLFRVPRTDPSSLTPSAVGDDRAREVHRAAQQRCRELDAEYSPLPGAPAGTRYPSPAEQVDRELRGPVLEAYEDAVGALDGGQMHGLAVGSWQDCSEEVRRSRERPRTPWPRVTGG